MHPFINTNDAWILKCRLSKHFPAVRKMWNMSGQSSRSFLPCFSHYHFCFLKDKRRKMVERGKEREKDAECFDLSFRIERFKLRTGT